MKGKRSASMTKVGSDLPREVVKHYSRVKLLIYELYENFVPMLRTVLVDMIKDFCAKKSIPNYINYAQANSTKGQGQQNLTNDVEEWDLG